jgi:hypothetical protein
VSKEHDTTDQPEVEGHMLDMTDMTDEPDVEGHMLDMTE